MSAASLARCDYCGDTVPVNDTFQPVSGGTVTRCRDVAACDQRQIRKFDPTILPAEDRPARPVSALPGTVCRACQTVTGGGLYQRSPGAWYCRNQDACQQAGLQAWSDSSPDQMIAAAEMWAISSSRPPENAREPSPPTPEALFAYEVHRAAQRAGR